jgi:hypothetical protein
VTRRVTEQGGGEGAVMVGMKVVRKMRYLSLTFLATKRMFRKIGGISPSMDGVIWYLS